ncbi:MAG TPA: YqhG family protein [Bacillota bacterium]|nr:YqhG family protein [Bacillota bacterium]
MPETAETIFNFVVDSLKISGAPYNVINNELVMAQCQVQIPRTFFRPARMETVSLQMVCRPDLASKYPGSELVTSGSYRLQWFIDGIKERGLIVRGMVPYELDPRKTQRAITTLLGDQPQFYFERPSLVYQPHFLVNFKISLETDEKLEEQHSLSINLVSGAIDDHLLTELESKKVILHPPQKPKPEKRRISYREGFTALLNHLKWLLQNHDRKWIESAKTRWEKEVTCLESYYRENEDDEGAGDAESGFYRRAAEIYRKFQPVIRIWISNAGILFLPLVIYTVEAYEPQVKLSPIIYDPIRAKISGLHKDDSNLIN